MSLDITRILSVLRDSETTNQEELAALIREFLLNYPVLNLALVNFGRLKDWLHILMFLLNIEGTKEAAVSSLIGLRSDLAKATTDQIAYRIGVGGSLDTVNSSPTRSNDFYGKLLFQNAKSSELITIPGSIVPFLGIINLFRMKSLIIRVLEMRTQYHLRQEATDRLEVCQSASYHYFRDPVIFRLCSCTSTQLERLVELVLASVRQEGVDQIDLVELRSLLRGSSEV